MYLAKSSGVAGTVENVVLSCRLCHQAAAKLTDCAPVNAEEWTAGKLLFRSVDESAVASGYMMPVRGHKVPPGSLRRIFGSAGKRVFRGVSVAI